MIQTPTNNVIQITCIFLNGQASTPPWRCEVQKEEINLPKGGLSCPNLFAKWLRNQMEINSPLEGRWQGSYGEFLTRGKRCDKIDLNHNSKNITLLKILLPIIIPMDFFYRPRGVQEITRL